MKQSEFDKILNKLLKDESIRFGWKSSRGFVFKRESEIFFTLLITGQPKNKRLSWSISFKHYEFDNVFWDIVKLPENKKQPLSFRACGAWVAPSLEIESGYEILDTWDEKTISEKIRYIFEILNPISHEIAVTINSYEKNIKVIEQHYLKLIIKYPNALRTLWVERILTCFIESRFTEAKDIANSRILAGDVGGFSYGERSFYHLANEYNDRVKDT